MADETPAAPAEAAPASTTVPAEPTTAAPAMQPTPGTAEPASAGTAVPEPAASATATATRFVNQAAARVVSETMTAAPVPATPDPTLLMEVGERVIVVGRALADPAAPETAREWLRRHAVWLAIIAILAALILFT